MLVVRSSDPWRGEDEREIGFRTTLRRRAPSRRQVEVLDDGRDDRLRAIVADALRAAPSVAAVYCMYLKGGTASAVADAVADVGPGLPRVRRARPQRRAPGPAAAGPGHRGAAPRPRAGPGHGVPVVLHAHGALPGPVAATPAPVQVVTPYNLPHALPCGARSATHTADLPLPGKVSCVQRAAQPVRASTARRCSALAATSSSGPRPAGSSTRIVSCSMTYQPSYP